MRVTRATGKVLSALLADPTADHYGYDLMRATGLKSGALYPILERLHQAAWVERQWERLDEGAGRRPRRLYRLTGLGERAARQALRPATPKGRVEVQPT